MGRAKIAPLEVGAHRKHAVRVPGSAQFATCVTGDVCGGDHEETTGCHDAGGGGGGGVPRFFKDYVKDGKLPKEDTKQDIEENKNSMCRPTNLLTMRSFRIQEGLLDSRSHTLLFPSNSIDVPKIFSQHVPNSTSSPIIVAASTHVY